MIAIEQPLRLAAAIGGYPERRAHRLQCILANTTRLPSGVQTGCTLFPPDVSRVNDAAFQILNPYVIVGISDHDREACGRRERG